MPPAPQPAAQPTPQPAPQPAAQAAAQPPAIAAGTLTPVGSGTLRYRWARDGITIDFRDRNGSWTDAEAAQAHRDLESRKTTGSVVLIP